MQNFNKKNSTHTRFPIHLARFCAVLLMLNSGFSVAQQPIPDSGSLLQQTVPTLPAVPSTNDTGIEQLKRSGITDETPFVVSKINFKGNTLVSTEVLENIVSNLEGTEQTLTTLQDRVYFISDYYHNAGYPFARAIIPQQEVVNGAVIIEIIEAKYGEIKLDNKSDVNNSLISETLSILKPNSPIAQKELDRALLLLKDLPGTRIATNIKAGKAIASSDFLVKTEKTDRFLGQVSIDSYGNRFINRPRVGASLYLLNPAKHGDVLSVNLLSTGKRMQYGQIAYDFLLNSHGTHIGANYAGMHYALGEELAALGVNGRSKIINAWVKHPFVRGTQYNVYGGLEYNHTQLEDKVDTQQSNKERTVKSVSLTLNGDLRDQLITPAVSSWRVSFTEGDVNYQDATAKANDAISAATEGHFSKLNVNVNRLQRMMAKTDLWVSLTAQAANDNLDSSQKMVFGGPFSVRAYDTGAVSGDSGYLATVEVRHLLSQQYGAWQAIAFVDMAQVEVNQDKWAGVTGNNKTKLRGVGIGLNWQKDNLSAKASIATSVGSSSSLTEDSDKSIAWVGFTIGL